MKPIVSVIIPNYNHNKYLKKRIDSVINQSFQNFELILLDDASTDDSLSILRKYEKHPKVSHFIVNKKNSGSAFLQWNKGLELATGKYIWIAESDDYSDLNFLEETVNVLSKNKNIGLVSSDLNIINENNKILDAKPTGKNKNSYRLNKKIYVVPWKEYIKGCFYAENAIYNASGVLFRKINIDVGNIYYTKKQYGDTFFWANFYLNEYDIAFLDIPLNYFRLHDQSTTKINMLENRKTVIQEEYQFINFLISKSLNFEIKSAYKNFAFNRVLLKYIKYRWNKGLKLFFFQDLIILKEARKFDKIFILRLFKIYNVFLFKKFLKKMNL